VGVGDPRALCNPRALCDPWALCVCEASNTFVIPSDKPSSSSISSVVSCLPAMISLKDGNAVSERLIDRTELLYPTPRNAGWTR
jgi:hypothetical protein